MRFSFRFFLGISALATTAYASPKSEAKTAQAIAELEQGNPAAAQSLLEEATAIDPADAEARYHLGRVLLKSGKVEEAIKALQAAVEGGYPNSFALGVAYYQAGKLAEAEKALADSLAYQKQQPEAHYYMGLVHLQQARYTQAADAFLAAREDEALKNQADYQRGIALQRAGQTAEATQILSDVAAAGDPSLAAQAQAQLDKLKPVKAWRLKVDLAHQFDSNVILAQTDRTVAAGLYDPEEIDNRNGQRLALTLGADYNFRINKAARVSVGYNGYQSYHRTNREILQNYDVLAHTLAARGEYQAGAWLGALSLGGNMSTLGPVTGARAYQGETPEANGYSRSIVASPLVLRSLGKSHGVGVGYNFGLERFAHEGAEVPTAEGVLRTDRGNASHGLDVLYLWRFADKGFLTPSAGVFMSDARGDDNIWDHQGGKLQLRAAAPIAAGFSAGAFASGSVRTYATAYPVDRGGEMVLEDRRDRELNGGLNLQWQYKGFRTQAGIFTQRNLSTVAEYDYSRFVYSVGLGADL
jgi:Flp pilus assembly protein TadD